MFINKGNFIDGIIHFSPREALQECENGAIIVDLRRDYEIRYKAFNVPNILIVKSDYLHENYEELPKDKDLIFADNAGLRSREMVAFLKDKGFINIANLAGGMFEWDNDKMPLLINNSEQLNGACLCVLRKNKKG